MLFKRVLTTSKDQLVPMRAGAGTGVISHVQVKAISADAAATLTVADIAGGCVQFTGFTAGRNVTTPTAAAMLDAATDMDVGDSFSILCSVVPAFAATWVAGTGVTLAGRATTPASTCSQIVVTKLSATTVEWRVL